MDFPKGEAVEGFPFEMIDKSGDPITTGNVTGYITKDGGTQEALSMTPVHEGNGQWSINISAAEMSADIIGLLFLHDGGNFVPQHFTIRTLVEAEGASTYVPGTSVGVVTSEDLVWNYYGTISRANAYFSKRLNTKAWDNAVYGDREAALIMATRAIDRLNFAGDKNDSTQDLQFPRGDDTEVPASVEYANYELALTFLDEVDMDQEIQTLGVLSETYSGMRTTYDADYVNEHIRAGIPSIEAWEYLRPFLRDPTQVRISRVS
jgi:hypothetical protein